MQTETEVSEINRNTVGLFNFKTVTSSNINKVAMQSPDQTGDHTRLSNLQNMSQNQQLLMSTGGNFNTLSTVNNQQNNRYHMDDMLSELENLEIPRASVGPERLVTRESELARLHATDNNLEMELARRPPRDQEEVRPPRTA